MNDAPMTCAELARRLGHDASWLYRRDRQGRSNVDLLMIRDRMPAPLTSFGRRLWDRASMEAWLQRHAPHAPARPPANENFTTLPASDDEWRAALAEEYGERR